MLEAGANDNWGLCMLEKLETKDAGKWLCRKWGRCKPGTGSTEGKDVESSGRRKLAFCKPTALKLQMWRPGSLKTVDCGEGRTGEWGTWGWMMPKTGDAVNWGGWKLWTLETAEQVTGDAEDWDAGNRDPEG